MSKSNFRDTLSLEEVNEWFRFDETTGKFFWKKRSPNQKHAPGSPAGCDDGRYVVLRVNRKIMLAHRVVWLIKTGQHAPKDIDHIDLNGCNNRFENLRLATSSENRFNRKKGKQNTSGYKGVYPKPVNKFGAHIRANKIGYYLGTFETAKEAHAAYCEAAHLLHGEFARVA